MAVNYVITADIIDVRIDTPKQEDIFLVDSNVWYWMTYTKASLSNQPQTLRRVRDYSAFVNNAIAVSMCSIFIGVGAYYRKIRARDF